MIGAMKRHEVQVLRKAGLRNGQVVRASGVSLRSVRRIVAEPPRLHRARHALPEPRRDPVPADAGRRFVGAAKTYGSRACLERIHGKVLDTLHGPVPFGMGFPLGPSGRRT